MRRALVAAAILLAAAVFITVNDPPPPTPDAPGTFSFAVFGDAPYYFGERMRYRVLLRHIDAHDLAAVIHIGDLFWRPCSDAMYRRRRAELDALRHPVVYTPGDNEWTDCWEERIGGQPPLQRLSRLRAIFYDHPTRSLGRRSIPLESQPRYPENARWRDRDVVFATVHLVGSENAMEPFPGRTAANDSESRERTAAAAEWTRQTFAAARATNAHAVVIAFHAGFGLEDPRYVANFEPFITTLQQEAVRYARPVLIAHGDWHEYTVDRPLPAAPNITRLQVPGSPDVGWVRVSVRRGAKEPFGFASYIVPWWKWW